MSEGFVPGLELARRFYREAVAPLLAEHVPKPVHTAALLGPGSEVLGFDTARSTDHNWGPRLQLLLDNGDADRYAGAVADLLADRLPAEFLGYPTSLVPVGADGTRHMRITGGRVHHAVEVAGLDGWLAVRLGFDPCSQTTLFDWLATPAQQLAEITGGEVFHDGTGRLRAVRRRLAWYPDDVWRYVLTCQWQRISQEEAFTGRCAEVGDECGAAVVAARLVRDLMRLCLLMARRYPPYGKWLGSAFARLPCAPSLTPVLTAAMAAASRSEREDRLAAAYESVAGMHNALGLTPEIDPRTRPYHARPYRVLHAERFAAALRFTIADGTVRALPLIGTVDQCLDSTDVLTRPMRRRAAAAALYPGC
ncbi:DUF4037 domain-containing protein [Streptomonospora sp. PA3]|uniref:DUF4037 domain-containing protein n=1 Tax=Streptomonospora sp. PA3 TaxID=2607326 RepID=UPI0012DE624B|nr:DUF4037 domain-containing protein [Streptomonospora sp. PA3]MUL41410.1 DUF4037 domain-containing protein [Streptomonospora sp. PA3]